MNSGSGNSSPLSKANSSTFRLDREVDILKWVINEKENWTENISSAIMEILIAASNAKRKGLQFMFSWNNVPGEDNEKLLRFLWDDLDIGWAKIAEITKSDNPKRIRIFKDENLAEITIDENEEKATLKIRDGETYDLKVKNENGKLNIYGLKNLLILAIKDKDYKSLRRHVYIYDSERKLIYPVSGIVARDALKYYNDLIKDLNEHKLTNKEVAKSGGYLFKKLIPDVISGRLQNKLAEGPDKVKWWVWIYCNDAEFNPLWEWLYTLPSNNTAPETSNVENQKSLDENTPHSKKSFSHSFKWAYLKKRISQKFIKRQQPIENDKEKGFFWGDNFFLVRVVPGECKIQEESVFEIDKVAVLRQKSGGCKYSSANVTYIDKLCNRKSKEISDIDLRDYNALKELVKDSDRVDYILHVAAGNRFIQSDEVRPVLDILKKLNKKPLLLFLNIYECDLNIRSEFINSIPTKTWIDTSSGVAENIVSSCKFTEFFYEEFFDNGKNVVVAATEARRRIKIDKDLDDSHKLWRLAYVVNGNDCIKIT